MREYVEFMLFIFAVWAIVSFTTSAITADKGYCNANYPIHYILYSKLFCEIKVAK